MKFFLLIQRAAAAAMLVPPEASPQFMRAHVVPPAAPARRYHVMNPANLQPNQAVLLHLW